MTRGRRPVEAIRLAIRIAEKRGEVQHFRHGPGMICTFVIYCPGIVAHVRVKRIRHLRCTAPWLERETADELASLRIIASSPAISRELWICSPRGNFRFFRVMDDALAELDREGRQLHGQAPAKKQRGCSVQVAISEPGHFPPVSPPAGTLEVSVGEKTAQDHTGGEVPRLPEMASFLQTEPFHGDFAAPERFRGSENVPNS